MNNGLSDDEKAWPMAWQAPSKRRRSVMYRLAIGLLVVQSIVLTLHLWQSLPPDTSVGSYMSWKHFGSTTDKASFSNKSQGVQKRGSVVKITGLYGSGSWLSPAKGQIDIQAMYSRAIKTHSKHAQRHGHKQVVAKKKLFGIYVDNAYTKIGNLMEQNLVEMANKPANETRWLFWHDADTIVTNREVSLDLFVKDVEQDQNVQLLYTKDQNGLNAGVFFIRVGEWASLFLASILAKSKQKVKEDLYFWEQTAMSNLLAENAFFGNVSVEIPRPWCNQYAFLVRNETTDTLRNPFPPGDFLVHLVANDKHKKGWFDFYLKIGEGQDKSYHNQTMASDLQKEMTAFWANQTSLAH